jgi:ATP-dependent protease HslVU (ClpYQ) peptidase subunit
MSIVIGYRARDGVYFAADYQVTSDDGHREYAAQKIFAGDDYLIGVAGDYKIVNLMEHFSFKWPKGDKKKFLVTELPLIIRDYLEPYAITGKEESDEYSILIGYEDGMCEITETFEASFYPVFHAIGTGAPYAFGAYHAMNFEFNTDTEQILTVAVGAANRYNAYCGGGWVIEKLPD